MSVQSDIANWIRTRRDRIDGRFGEYDLAGMALLSPVLLFFVVVSLIPILYGIWLSFQTGTGAVDLSYTGVSNYVEVLQDPMFWSSAWRGVVFAVYSVALQLGLGVALALALNQRIKFANITRAIIFLPYMIPTIAVAAMFKWILQNRIGVLNYILVELGIIAERMTFFTEALAMHTIVWASTWKWTVFVVLLVLARLQAIDETLYEAAKTNGASTFRQFMDVTLPQIKSILLLIVLLRTIWQFSKFEMIYLLTQGGPFDATTTLVIYAYDQAFGGLNFGLASATTTLLFVLLIAFAVVYFGVFSPEEEVEVTDG